MSRAVLTTLVCVLALADALRLVSPRAGRVVACTDGGLLAGPWWDAFNQEVQTEADALGLTVREVSFANGRLSVLASGAGVDELQQLNSFLSGFIDQSADESVEKLPPFLLEVASPGLSSVLESDRDFAAFKGFPVTVTTTEEYKKKTR